MGVPPFPQRHITQAKIRREIDHPHAGLQQSRCSIQRNPVGCSEENDITLPQPGILRRLERELEMSAQIREQGVDTYACLGSRSDALHLRLGMQSQQPKQLDSRIPGPTDDSNANLVCQLVHPNNES